MLSENRYYCWIRNRLPELNFLIIHCNLPLSFSTSVSRSLLTPLCVLDVYIINCVMVGSLLIYAGGNIEYIDALFFASGSCTQAGLNTIDVKLLTTWQQVYQFDKSKTNFLY